jgi:hypothetical protein
MHQTADASDVSYFIKAVLKNASNENVAGEERLYHMNDSAPRRPFQAQAGMEDLQSEPLADVCGRYMLVFGLRSGTIPC